MEIIVGGSGNDVIGWKGGAVNYETNTHYIDGGAGNDTLTGSIYSDTLSGGAGDDVLNGGSPPDGYYYMYPDYVDYHTVGAPVVVNLTRGTASGGAGNDKLIDIEGVIGSNGADEITGSAQQGDYLAGGGGADILDGGFDGYTDVFIYGSVSESTALAMDTIRNFSSASFGADQIDLHAVRIDAAGGYGGQFEFLGREAFTSTARQVRYANVAGNTLVYADVDGNGVADMTIKLLGTHTLTSSSFVL